MRALKVEGVTHVQSFSPAIESAAQHADPPPKAAQETAAAPTENVVDLQFDPVKLSQSVVLGAREERAEDDTQLLLFPELADEAPPADTKVAPMRPDPAPVKALGTDLPSMDPELASFPRRVGLMTQALKLPADRRRAALRSSPEILDKLRALQAKMSG